MSTYGPLYYDGYPITNEGQLDDGHAFVCDGYSEDGYFHINWGWGGLSNGYFRLSALEPTSLGIGGGYGAYNYHQTCAIGLVPDNWGEVKPFIGLEMCGPAVLCPLGSDDPGSEFALTTPVDCQYYAFSITKTTIPCLVPGLRLESPDGTSLILSSGIKVENVELGQNVYPDFTVTFPSDLADGVYKVYSGFEDNFGEWHDLIASRLLTNYVYLTVSAGSGRFEYTGTVLPKVAFIDAEETIYDGVAFKIQAEMTNLGDSEFNNQEVFIGLFSPDDLSLVNKGGYTIVNILPHESKLYTMTCTFNGVAPGKYYLAAVVETDYEEYTRVSDLLDVEVKIAPEGDFDIEIKNLECSTSMVDDSTGEVKVSLDIECLSGIGETQMTMAIYNSGWQKLCNSNETVRISAGQTKHCEFSLIVDDVVQYSTYYLQYSYRDDDGEEVKICGFWFDDSGIEPIEAEESNVILYDIMGRRVQSSQKGVVLRVKVLSDGTKSVERVIR